jgi:hypothetical protein
MLNAVSGTSVIRAWLITLAVVIAFSVAVGADVSTSALLLAMGVTPVVIVALIGRHAAPPTMAEILYPVEVQDGR